MNHHYEFREIKQMNTNEIESFDSRKLPMFIMLAYLVPVLGIGFALYILNYTNTYETERWVPMAALAALFIQIIPILFAVLGILTWYTGA